MQVVHHGRCAQESLRWLLLSLFRGARALNKREWLRCTVALAALVKQYLEQSQDVVMKSFTRHLLFYEST